jgi:hypothetical protein
VSTLFFSTADFKVKHFQDRRAIDEIEMVMSAFDCLIEDNSAIYCSSEITTGKRFYNEVLIPYGASSDKELKARLGDEEYKQLINGLIKQNVARGREFTEKLRERGLVNLLTPGPFYARDFDQDHYLYLWEWVIIKKIYEARFAEAWEYSNGCTFEYAVASRKGIPRFDHLGYPLNLHSAVERIGAAIEELKQQGLAVDKLEANLALMNTHSSP